MGLFKIISKVMVIIYTLDLLLRMKIYLVNHITMLKLGYRDYKLLVYR